jgi:hypothetical protein
MIDPPVIATGPRRALLRASTHRPYFAAPFGDMMLSGCFGLLAAMGDILPNDTLRGLIRDSLNGKIKGKAPWDS